jgi:hypothetical protein
MTTPKTRASLRRRLAKGSSNQQTARTKSRRMSASRKALLVVWRDRPVDGWPHQRRRVERNAGKLRPDLPILQCQGCARHETHWYRAQNTAAQTQESREPKPQWKAAVMSMKGESDQMGVSDDDAAMKLKQPGASQEPGQSRDQDGWFGATAAIAFSSCCGRPSKPMSPLCSTSEISRVRMVGVT